jgi:hypothetical protein
MIDSRDLDWREFGDGLALHLTGAFEPVAHIERDGFGWRVRWQGGRRSELMSIGAAKEHAASVVLAAANRRTP